MQCCINLINIDVNIKEELKYVNYIIDWDHYIAHLKFVAWMSNNMKLFLIFW